MSMTQSERRWAIFLFAVNAGFWAWFWLYFFTHPTSPHTSPSWEGGVSWAKVLGKNFGDGSSLVAVLNMPVVRMATILFLPCFVLTWPITRWLPAGFDWAGFDAQGLRLAVITALSFFQWVIVMKVARLVGRRLATRR